MSHQPGTAPRAVLPRRMWRHPVQGTLFDQLRELSPRQRWIAEQTMWRYQRRTGAEFTVLRGELGTWNGMTIIKDIP